MSKHLNQFSFVILFTLSLIKFENSVKHAVSSNQGRYKRICWGITWSIAGQMELSGIATLLVMKHKQRFLNCGRFTD